MPTINDVAKRAGVSRSTVSLVLNHSKLVKEDTRRLVEQVIHEINYVPNSNARGLSARVTNNLGVIFMKDYLHNSTQVSYDSDQHIGLCSFNILKAFFIYYKLSCTVASVNSSYENEFYTFSLYSFPVYISLM